MVQDLEGEVWVVIKNYPDYLVSNKGRVKSAARWYDNKSRGWRFLKEKLLVCGVNSAGYCRVSFSLGSRDVKTAYRVHRLVAEAFLPNPDNKPQVNHINGIKTDNRVENLEWSTAKENVVHAIGMGLRSSVGSNNVKAKYKESDVLEIRRLFASGVKNKDIHKLYPKLSYESLAQITNGRTWKHL